MTWREPVAASAAGPCPPERAATPVKTAASLNGSLFAPLPALSYYLFGLRRRFCQAGVPFERHRRGIRGAGGQQLRARRPMPTAWLLLIRLPGQRRGDRPARDVIRI
jgi:hypothetical protein